MASKKNRSKAYVPEAVENDDSIEHVTEPETEELSLTYLVKDGENILTVAEKFKPADVSRADYAKTLANLNGTVIPGRLVRLV